MQPIRFAATGAAAALVALGMAGPVHAAAAPRITATPNPFTPGATLSLRVTECQTEPVTGSNQIFTAAPDFTGSSGGPWTAQAPTRSNLEPGETYTTRFTCQVAGGTSTLTLTVSPGEQQEEPKFSFGFDDVKLSSTRVVPNGTTTFTVTCPTKVTIRSNAYTQNPLTVRKTGENTWTATGTFKSSLPDPSVARVTCQGFGTVTFSTSPAKGEMKPGKPTGRIPTGRIDTGDGSTQAGSGLTAAAGSSAAAALAAVGLGAFALRRIGRERS